jgi:hypothetical protein
MLIEALNRTLLLMGTALKPSCSLEMRLKALTDTRVVIRFGAAAAATYAGQTAVITAALLLARSGHAIWLDGPEVPLLGPQPPLTGDRLLAALLEAGQDLLPDCAFQIGCPAEAPDLSVLIGEVEAPEFSRQVAALNSGDGWASLGAAPEPWLGGAQPLGGLAAGALAAGEGFKAAMRRLRDEAPLPAHFDAEFAPTQACRLELAPAGALHVGGLPPADLVSGGAIGNAIAFCLLRMPGLSGELGVLDDDRSDLTNLNRNALLRRSAVGALKVDDLAGHATGGVRLLPRPVRYSTGQPLAPQVLIGVDDIPSRWAAQATSPDWIGVGATAGFAVQVSEHQPGEPCAGCLHPEAASASGPIPTAAFVSFWSGLLLTARWLRRLAGEPDPHAQTYFSPLRPEGWPYASFAVAANPHCPVACPASGRAQAA